MNRLVTMRYLLFTSLLLFLFCKSAALAAAAAVRSASEHLASCLLFPASFMELSIQYHTVFTIGGYYILTNKRKAPCGDSRTGALQLLFKGKAKSYV